MITGSDRCLGTGLALLILMGACGQTASAGVVPQKPDENGLPGHIPSEAVDTILQWLKANPQYRLATDVDCDCADDVADIRAGAGGAWPANPGYQPYYAAGDFDGDGHADLAIAVHSRASGDDFRVVLFNGAWPRSPAVQGAFVSPVMAPTYAMSYGPPRPAPYRLIIGPYSSHGCTLDPLPGWKFKLDCETEH